MCGRAAWQALRPASVAWSRAASWRSRAAYADCCRASAVERSRAGNRGLIYAAAALTFSVAAAQHLGPNGSIALLEEKPKLKPAVPAAPTAPSVPAEPAVKAEPAVPAAPADPATPKPDPNHKSEPEAKPKTTSRTTKRPSGTISVDQEALRARRLFLTGDINDDMAKAFVQQILYLESEDPETPVTVYINSGGGSVHSGLAILDIMSSVRMPVATVAYGRAMSIAALLLAGGTPGRRSAYANTRLMVHEPSCSYPKLQASDLKIKMAELERTRQTMVSIFASRVGRPEAEVAEEIGRDRYLSAAEAKTFGLLDTVFEDPRPPVPERPKLGSAAVSAAEAESATPAGTASDSAS